MEGYFLDSHLKNAGTPMALSGRGLLIFQPLPAATVDVLMNAPLLRRRAQRSKVIPCIAGARLLEMKVSDLVFDG